MAKGGGSADDIVKAVLARLGVKPAAAAKGAARKAPAKVAPKASPSVPAKAMSKAERKAANSARNKATQEKLIAERQATAPARKAAKTEANRAKGTARANRKTDEAYGGPNATDIKIEKARAYYEREVDKLQRTIDATERKLTKGSQGRRDMLKKDLENFKKRYDLPKLSAGDSLGVVRESLKLAQDANRWSKKRLEQLIKQTEGKDFKQTVQMGARRARVIENKTGKRLTGSTPARITKKEIVTQKRLAELRSKGRFDAVIKKADSKMGPARGPRKKTAKKFEKTPSEIKLEQAQAANARKSVIDPKVAKMSPAQRKKFLASENKKWKSLKDVKISGRGMTDAEAKKKLADLGEREIRRSAVRAKKVKPSPEGLRRQFSSKEPRK
jgi:hypothetical protein